MPDNRFSLRRLLVLRWSWVFVLVAPALALLVMVAGEIGFRIPAPLGTIPCFKAATSVPLGAMLQNGTIVLSAPVQPTVDATAGNARGCAEHIAATAHGRPATSVVAARGLAITVFLAALVVAVGLALFCLVTIGRFAGGGSAVVLAVAVSIVLTFMALFLWLPHKVTLDLMALADATEKHATGYRLDIAGCALAIVLAVLYVGAQAAVACVGGRPDASELAKRFDRLTTLSGFGSIAFAMAIATLVSLVSWPAAIEHLNPDFAGSATTIYALFGTYLTVVLVAGYVPAAAILGAKAEALAPAEENLRGWLQKNGLTINTTARVSTLFATLIPLIAGVVTSTSAASSALTSSLKQ